MTGSPLYDELRPRFLNVDLPDPDPPAPPGRHALHKETTMALTGATIRAALAAVKAVGKQLRTFDELAAGAADALQLAPPGLTVDGAASWLATQAQESDYFRTTREYARNPTYAPWVGRTFEQLTHQEAYQRFGVWCRDRGLVDSADVFVRNPTALEDYRWAWLGGVFYFEWRGLWPIANRGDHLEVSRIVNAGPGWAKRLGPGWKPNGWAAREAMFLAFRTAGDALLPGSGRPAGSTPPALPRGGPEMPIELYFFDDKWRPDPNGLNWRGRVDCEVDGTSGVIAEAWVRWGVTWGGSTIKVVAWDAVKPIAEPTPDEYRRDYWPVPAAARSITVEGRRQHSAAIPSARLVEKPKTG